MPRGYRSIIVAAFGCLILGAQGPQPKSQPKEAEATRQVAKGAPAVPPPPVQPVEPVQRPEIERPCEPGQDDRNSDLCAQWKAADAATEAAFWARWSFVLGIFGMLGLFATLHYTRKAVNLAVDTAKDADKAIELAERSAEASAKAAEASVASVNQARRSADAAVQGQRPWITLSSQVADDLRLHTQQPSITILARMENRGKTPALSAFFVGKAWVHTGNDGLNIWPHRQALIESFRDGHPMGNVIFPGDDFGQRYVLMLENAPDPSAPRTSLAISIIGLARYSFPGGEGMTGFWHMLHRRNPETGRYDSIWSDHPTVHTGDLLLQRMPVGETAT